MFATVTCNHYYQASLKKERIVLAKQGLHFWLQNGNKINKWTNKKHRSKKIQFQHVPCSGSHLGFLWGAKETVPLHFRAYFSFGFLPASTQRLVSLQERINFRTFHWTFTLPSFDLERILMDRMVVLINPNYFYECKWNPFKFVHKWIISDMQWSFDTLISTLRFTLLLLLNYNLIWVSISQSA